MKKERKSIQGMAISGKLISVSGLESVNCKGAAGITKLHRKIVVTTSDNQAFAFHLWGKRAKEFAGKVGDRIIVEYTSQVHVSRGGIIHNNLTITRYGFFWADRARRNEVKPKSQLGKETGSGDDYSFLVPVETEKRSTIGTKGLDYPDFDMEADDNYHAPNGVWSRMKDRIERMCCNNKGGNYEAVC